MARGQQETPEYPQPGRERLILLPPVAILGTDLPDTEKAMVTSLSEQRVFMMGDNPVLPRMPKAPRLLDFFRLRFTRITGQHLLQSAKTARANKWYMTSRLITIYDIYAFKENEYVDPEEFTDVIGRNFKEPREGLGFDGSPAAHMWRTMIWPNNFL